MDTNKLLYWSPVFRWEIVDGCLKIELFNYGQQFSGLFPEFYFYTQKGILEEDLIEKMSYKNNPLIKKFIRDLIKRQILIYSPLEIQQLVHIQNYLFDNKYDEKIKYDAETLENFKEIQLTRNPVMEQKIMDEIKIPTNNFSHMIEKRKSVRVFDNETLMDKEKFIKIISILRERDAITHRYYYASAGGLYPIDVYVYIKENRIKEIPGGLYYYSPKLNCLQKIKKENVINEESQYFMNKDIFSHSAFSIYFIYDADVSMPKYGGMAYIYACIDTGIMVSLLTYIAEAEEVGSCSIGEMDYKKIKPLFPLTSNMSFLHSMEFGIKK